MVRVQLKWRHQYQFAGYYAAIEKGFYREVGLGVSVSEDALGVTPVDQLMLGRVEFAVADTGALIYRSTGVPLVALAATFQHSPSILMTRADSGIEKLEDLKFRRLMLGGGFMNAELIAMLQRGGLSFEELNVVPGENTVEALIAGRAEAYNAYTTNEPFFMEKRGVPYRVFQPRDYGVDFYGDILLTTEALIEESPKLVEDFRAATMKGWAYAVEHPEEVVDIILAKYNSQSKSREHLLFEARELTKLILPSVVPIGYMNQDRWRRIENVFLAQGRLARRVDLSKFLYSAGEFNQFLAVLDRHRVKVITGGIAVIALLMVFYIVSLRFQIRARTSELEDAKRRAEEDARTDVLTGLPNRRQFLEVFGRDLARAIRQNIPVTLILADIDHFKQINDQYGHLAGDEALRKVSDILSAHVRSGDVAARIGGEEFALGCFNTTLDETLQLAERLRHEVEATPIEFDGEPVKITLSFGLAERGPDRNEVDQIIDAADLALYEAKNQGRNRVHTFT